MERRDITLGKDRDIISWLRELVKNVHVIHNGIVGNGFTHCGEISCLKGQQGKRGYPF